MLIKAGSRLGKTLGAITKMGGHASVVNANRVMSSPVSLLAQYGLYQGAASFVDKYAEGNFSESGQFAAGVLSAGLRLKSYQVGARAVTRTAGFASSKINRFLPETFKKTSASLQFGGGVDKFMAGLGPLSLLRKGIVSGSTAKNGDISIRAGLLTKGAIGLAAFPINAVRGAGQYGRAFGRAVSSQDSWGTLATQLGAIEHQVAPMIATGMLAGGTAAVLNRYNPFSGFSYDSSPAPSVYGTDFLGITRGGKGPMNAQNFGGGISFGRPSAIKTDNVMRSQLAVTAAMTKTRRM